MALRRSVAVIIFKSTRIYLYLASDYNISIRLGTLHGSRAASCPGVGPLTAVPPAS